MARRLRKTRHRYWLWSRAKGRCSACGERLKKGWHADHIKPWSKGGETRLANMQALCPQCNLGKGGNYMKLRQHQERLKDLIQEVIAKDMPERAPIVMNVTPGGGKSKCAIMFAHDLIKDGRIDQVIILVPRTNLAKQLEYDFSDSESGYFNPSRFRIESISSEAVASVENLKENRCQGAVMTYQIFSKWHEEIIGHLRSEGIKIGVVFDECHFLANDNNKSWSKSAALLSEYASFSLVMTGTLFRQDNKKIPLVSYSKPDANGFEFPIADIDYSLKDGIKEKAVIRTEFRLFDGEARWLRDGNVSNAKISSPSEGDASSALISFLSSESVYRSLLDRAVSDWREWLSSHSRSRMVVCALSQSQASEASSYLRSKHGLRVKLAISDEGDRSKSAINSFQKGDGDVLVTVGMAYIGLDVKDLTHMVFLRNIRFFGYLAQAFARCSRNDTKSKTPWEDQWCFIYAPNDKEMCEYVEARRSEEAQGVREQEPRDLKSEGEAIGREGLSSFVPLDGSLGDAEYRTLDIDIQGEEARRLREIRESIPGAASIPSEVLSQILCASGGLQVKEPPSQTREDIQLTPSEEKKRLRDELKTRCRRIDRLGHQRFGDGWRFGTVNACLKGIFRKPRPKLSNDELRRAAEIAERWLEDASAGRWEVFR